MKQKLLALVLIILVSSCKETSSQTDNNISTQESAQPKGKDNLAYKWGQMAILGTAYDTERFKPRPTITSRYLGSIQVAVFDAWSRYDDQAIPVYLNGVERVPEAQRNLKNKEIAISYAALRALNEYYYSDSEIFNDYMRELGMDPDNMSMDPTTPEGIGNLAAKAVIEARKNDGANQYGEEDGSAEFTGW